MSTPNDTHTSMLRVFCVVLSLPLFGCGPEMSVGWGMGDTDGDVADDCARRDLAEYACDTDVCLARWDGTELWSRAWDVAEVSPMPDVDAGSVWTCTAAPDVDTCKAIDDFGHVGCFRLYGDWAVAVAPSCAQEGWLDVGCGMAAGPI